LICFTEANDVRLPSVGVDTSVAVVTLEDAFSDLLVVSRDMDVSPAIQVDTVWLGKADTTGVRLRPLFG
jgi:hypothetical protein